MSRRLRNTVLTLSASGAGLIALPVNCMLSVIGNCSYKTDHPANYLLPFNLCNARENSGMILVEKKFASEKIRLIVAFFVLFLMACCHIMFTHALPQCIFEELWAIQELRDIFWHFSDIPPPYTHMHTNTYTWDIFSIKAIV